jgi:hypothetical protein
MGSYDKLEEAGLIGPVALFTREQAEAIENLSDEDVQALITIWEKLRPAYEDKAGIQTPDGDHILPPARPRKPKTPPKP